MVENAYKLTMLFHGTYREVELTRETPDGLRVGVGQDCGVRFRRELFFEEFYLEFRRSGNGWQLQCSPNIHVTQDGVLKQQSIQLVHGLHFQVLSQAETEMFRCNFLLDFEQEGHVYDRQINLNGVERVLIGGSAECQVLLRDSLIGGDAMELARKDGHWVLTDKQSRYGVEVNGTLVKGKTDLNDYDFFSMVGHSFFLKEDVLYTAADRESTVSLPYTDRAQGNTRLVYPEFNRSTRIQYQMPNTQIEVQQPPPKPSHNKKGLIFSLLPSVAMLALVVVLRGIMGGGGTFVIYSVCSMGIGIVMSIATYFSEKKQFKEEQASRKAAYEEYIAQKRADIEALREQEGKTLELIHPEVTQSVAEVEGFGKRIFEIGPQDADFLQVRLGTGEVESACPVQYTKQEFVDKENPLSLLPEKMAMEYRALPNAPVIAHLADANAIGVVGTKPQLDEMVKTLSLDLALRHFYKEVRLCYLLSPNDAEKFSWLRWVQHTRNSVTGGRDFLYDDESGRVLLEFIYSEISRREAQASEGEDVSFPTHYVVFVLDKSAIAKHPVSKFIESGAKYGFTFLFFEEAEEFFPRGCGQIVRLNGTSGESAVLETLNGGVEQAFTPTVVSDAAATAAALRLAGIHVEEVALEQTLTKNITLFELFNILTPSDIDLERAWASSEVYKSMSAPIGVKRKNEIVSLDISDKASAHGPHGLVAGTTGSGKSEILQTYVLSMAVRFHPYDVSFVIIDFKGGGMANQFKDLPHLVGAITNIDGREIDRSLKSIKAELIRRQTLFSQSGVNHINDYIRLFKEGAVTQPLPHLIMIVDEFAELKAEYPDFMKEIISAARIGRTLGVHLILATQKPSGVVDNQIWSNSKFKLCLKVQSREDSNEVLHSPLAAEIVEPGRAYFQVGNNEIFELFQSAYSGASLPSDSGEVKTPCEIASVNLSGKKTMIYTNRGKSEDGNTVKQLDALVDYIHAYCQEKHIAPLPGICLPPLEENLKLSQLQQEEKKPGVTVAVGVYDDPATQRQGPYTLDLTAENTFVVGSTQMGKTTFLRTLARALITKYTPQEINLYLIDCGAMALAPFAKALHTGGVVLSHEEVRMGNLFKLLNRELARRRECFAQKGVGTYAAYLEAGFTDIPQIVIMLDNMATFREYYDELMDQFLVLTREGLGVGISFVIASSQSNALSFKAMANFSNRIAFTCTDGGEYSNLFGRGGTFPKEVPGRALVQMDKQVLECQMALGEEGALEIERSKELAEFIEGRNQALTGMKPAGAIPMVPEQLKEKTVAEEEPALFRTPYLLPLGMDYAAVDWVGLDLTQTGAFVLTGRDEAARINFTRYVLAALQRMAIFSPMEVHVFDTADGELSPAKELGCVDNYCADTQESLALMEELFGAVKHKRDQELMTVLILDDSKLIQALCTDPELSATFLRLIEKGAEYRVFMLLANVANSNLPFNAPEPMKRLREQRQGILFEALAGSKLYEAPNNQKIKQIGLQSSAGDCYLFQNQQILRIKTVQAEDGKEKG